MTDCSTRPTDAGAVEVVTFGCRLNTFESEVMRSHAQAAGLRDAVIFNTCAVTTEAERQARQAIRRMRRRRPQARIIVTGCAAQLDPGRFAAMPEVDRVLGNGEKLQAASFVAGAGAAMQVNDIMAVRETGVASDRRLRRARPGVRAGPERLRPPLHVLYHPLRPRPVAQRTDGRDRRADPPPRRQRLS